MTQHISSNALVGRQEELRRLDAAIQARESLLLWGPSHAGKMAQLKSAIESQRGTDASHRIYWTGAASVRQLVGEIVRAFYAAGDPVVREKIREQGGGAGSLERWVRGQTSGQLKVLAYAAAQRSRCWLFLDHLPPATRSMARLLKEIIWRCKTPVVLVVRGCSPAEIGHAWSLYFATEHHVRLGPLPECRARELSESCIRGFGLDSWDLDGFRERILRLSH